MIPAKVVHEPEQFDDSQPSKMAAHPCATHRLLKNGVFQQSVNEYLSCGRNFAAILLSHVEVPGIAGSFV